jgi:phosphopantetheinyl transferase
MNISALLLSDEAVIMQAPPFERLSAFKNTAVHVFSTPVRNMGVDDVPLAHAEEVATFATEKRRIEHLTGRWLLGKALQTEGVSDLSVIEVVRNEYRAPSLRFIQGVWKRTPLPNISISHSHGTAFVALAPPALLVGLDAEPLGRQLAENAYDMMAKGHELEHLRNTPEDVFRMWTGKEAVQKCLGKGMHLNPRDIQISTGSPDGEISIENLKIQLEYWKEMDYHLSLATVSANPQKPTPEDRLLEATRRAMEEQPDWGVGCKTQRSGA